MAAPDNHDTIAAIATPPGNSAIGIIRLSGPKALQIAQRIFISEYFSNAPLISRHLYYGHIIDLNDGSTLDDVLLAFMAGPNSYTGDDVIEINCHGGLTGMCAVMEQVLSCGARPAEPGEFTRRAFLNGRLDLAQAEAVIDLIESKTQASLKIAARQMSGSLSARVGKIRDALIDLQAHIEACIDFPDDEINELSREQTAWNLQRELEHIQVLIANAEQAGCYRTGIDVAIIGKPNVGKSSIMNVLLGDERSIVTSIPGTTRDIISETITIEGVPVRLHDTAGIHSNGDAVETIGIDRALEHMKKADITLFVFDGSNHLDNLDTMLLHQKKGGVSIALVNKADLVQCADTALLDKYFKKDLIITTSAHTHMGFDSLRMCIARLMLGKKAPAVSDIMITSIRHKRALIETLGSLKRAQQANRSGRPFELISADVQHALHSLGEITGETTSEDILSAIFSRFCIGK
jgi:tRNA modification GTPase